MKYLITSLLLLFCNIPLLAVQTRADSLYAVQNYKEAADEYLLQLENGISDELYYNLANCYYRMNDFPHAILNYQKVLKINPQHTHARENLKVCLEQSGAETYSTSEMFYTTWIKSLIQSRNANQWGTLAISTLCIFIGLVIIFLLSKTSWIKKLTFFTSILVFLCVILLNIFAYKSKVSFYTTGHVVTMQPILLYESATIQSRQVGEIPSGSILKLNEEFNNEWYNVNTPDGRNAWCQNQHLEKVEIK